MAPISPKSLARLVVAALRRDCKSRGLAPIWSQATLARGGQPIVSKTEGPPHTPAAPAPLPEEATATTVDRPTSSVELEALAPTKRQAEVLGRLLDGRTQAEAATAMGLSRRTVEFHLNELRDRTGIRRMSLLLEWARKHGRPGG